MKIFGYEFRKFEKENTTIETVETWVVEWISLGPIFTDSYRPKPMFKTFIDKGQAKAFAKELNDCVALLGDRDRMAEVYKQESPTNAK